METKAYLHIQECKRKRRLCISLEILHINSKGFIVNNKNGRYDEYESPKDDDWNWGYYEYKTRLSTV